MTTFKQRKEKGNHAENVFKANYPEARRTSSFAEDDYTTTTGDMPDYIKYMPDFNLWDSMCEVKSSCFYNQAEYDHHMHTYGPNMFVYVYLNGRGKLYTLGDLHIIGPFKGSSRGSGLPYYKMRIDL